MTATLLRPRAEILSSRAVQPGSAPRDNWRTVESDLTSAAVHYFVSTCGGIILDSRDADGKKEIVIRVADHTWVLREHSLELKDLFGAYGIVPELEIECAEVNRRFWLEAKFQGATGNAEERAAKLFTMRFREAIRERYSYNYHPFAVVMGGALAHEERYTSKFESFYYSHEYFLWTKHRGGDLTPGEAIEQFEEMTSFFTTIVHTILRNSH